MKKTQYVAKRFSYCRLFTHIPDIIRVIKDNVSLDKFVA